MSIAGSRVIKAKEYSDSALAARLAETLKRYESKSVRQNFSLTDGAMRDLTSSSAIAVDFLYEFSAQRFDDAAAKVTTDFANWIPGYGWSNWAEIVKIDREFLGQNFNTPFVLRIDSVTREGSWIAVETESTAGTRTGGQYNNHYLYLFKMRDDKIQLWFEYFDTLHTYTMFGFPDYSGDLTGFAQEKFSPLVKN